MGERKVLNKYYPPDFDPSKIPKRKRPKNEQIKVRMMLPMSVRCTTCGEFLYAGKKFNARKETVIGEEYLGVKIFRFYLKCTRCSAELTIKTDPKNNDYTAEFGATRNFEPWREKDKALEEAKEQREKEEEGDAMKALENRTHDAKLEMDILDALDEIKTLNARHARVNIDEVLDWRQRTEALSEEARRAEEEDERLLQSVTFHHSSAFVRRIEDDDGEDGESIVGDGKQKGAEEDVVAKVNKSLAEAAIPSLFSSLSSSQSLQQPDQMTTHRTTTTTTTTKKKPAKPNKPLIVVRAAKTKKDKKQKTNSDNSQETPPKEEEKNRDGEAEDEDDGGLSLVDY
ncbi:Splicing factor YJU2 [Balamuthia mandrillaris]